LAPATCFFTIYIALAFSNVKTTLIFKLTVPLITWAAQIAGLFCYVCQGAKVTTYLVPTQVFLPIMLPQLCQCNYKYNKVKCYLGSLDSTTRGIVAL